MFSTWWLSYTIRLLYLLSGNCKPSTGYMSQQVVIVLAGPSLNIKCINTK